MSVTGGVLKRLERAGKANSQTSRNLIEAVAGLAHAIVEQYEVPDKYVADVAPGFNRTRYAILNGRLVNAESRYVAENRDTALAFARDIADGLLDGVLEGLERRNQESLKALADVEQALKRLRSRA